MTRPTESAALESYLIDACERSTHMAIMVTKDIKKSGVISYSVHRAFGTCKPIYPIYPLTQLVHLSSCVKGY